MEQADIEAAVNFEPVPIEALEETFKWYLWYFKPKFLGMENVPQNEPLFFVSNHSIMSIPDMIAILGAYKASGKFIRPLGDRVHFKNPIMRGPITRTGGVVGDRDLCAALMEDRQSIYVFPGGGREVVKKRDEVYKLVWKKRLGFLKLALKYDYRIVPIGIAGGDETYDILFDVDDLMTTPLGKYMDKQGVFDKFRGKDEFPPLVKGIGPTMAPKPQPIYVAYGDPLDLSAYKDKLDDEKALFKARGVVEKAVSQLIAKGRREREKDIRSVPLWRRILNAS